MLSTEAIALLSSSVGAGLFLSHALSEFIPDALGITIGMGVCCLVGGFLAGAVTRRGTP